MSETTQVLFEPVEMEDDLNGLLVKESLLKIPGGVHAANISIPVTNRSPRDIVIEPRSVLGELHYVKSVMQISPTASVSEERESRASECGSKWKRVPAENGRDKVKVTSVGEKPDKDKMLPFDPDVDLSI